MREDRADNVLQILDILPTNHTIEALEVALDREVEKRKKIKKIILDVVELASEADRQAVGTHRGQFELAHQLMQLIMGLKGITKLIEKEE